MDKKKALLIIDYTNDFIADDGALTCGEPGQKIENKIISLADEFYQNGNFVYLPTDTHIKDDKFHPETKLFPTHNVKGTKGHELYGKLKIWYDSNSNSELVNQFDKTRYSSFAGTDLDLRLREREVTDLYLTGVCTDICVLHTAIDAYNLGYSINVYKEAVASFSQTGHDLL